MVRRITFDDQVSLVAKLRVPLIYLLATELQALQALRKWKSPARIFSGGFDIIPTARTYRQLTMRNRSHIEVPVPVVHSYNMEQANEVGFPYLT